MKKIAGIIMTAIGAASAAISLLSQISVAVIGGADGPTSISFAGKIGGVPAIIGTIAGIALFIFGIFMMARKSRSQ